MEQTETLNDLSYQILKDRYFDGTLSAEATFNATLRLMDDSGFKELGFTDALRNILSFLESPNSERLKQQRLFSPLRRDAQSRVDSMKYNASKYDGVHSNPQQDDLMSILRHLNSLSDDKSLWRIDRDKEGNVVPHDADKKITKDRVRQDPQVAKIFAQKAEKQKEVEHYKTSVARQFKREILEGFFSPHQRPWSSTLKTGAQWIRDNLKDGADVIDNMARTSTELSKVGYMMTNYGGDIHEVVQIFSRMSDTGIKEIADSPIYES